MGKLEAAGTKWLRPPDYYAEMVKSDEHMARVKAQLMHEQGEIEGAQERCIPHLNFRQPPSECLLYSCAAETLQAEAQNGSLNDGLESDTCTLETGLLSVASGSSQAQIVTSFVFVTF